MRSGFWLWRPTLPPPVTVVRPLRDEKKEREQQCHVDLLSLTFHCTTMISDMKHYINEKNVYLADYVLHFSWYYCFPEIDNLHYLLHLMFLCILARSWVCLNKEKTWSHVFKMNTHKRQTKVQPWVKMFAIVGKITWVAGSRVSAEAWGCVVCN